MQAPVYFDYLASTPVDPRVAALMADCLTLDGNFGNPASRSHIYGWRAEQSVEQARRELADLINADPRELVWTSGATESDNLAIKGVAGFYGEHDSRRHMVTSRIEHKAVVDTCLWLERCGWEVTWLDPSDDGLTRPESVAAALRPDTALVSIMHANNELGTVNDIAAIGDIVRASGALFHVDAAQTVGKIPLDMAQLPVDLLSISAHKFYGPKGIGALYVRRQPRVQLEAQIHGGGHERGMRSGTLATHQIVGIGEAARIAREELAVEGARLLALRERLWRGVSALGGMHLNGHAEHRLPGALNVSVEGVEGETLLMALRGLALSSGSACNSESVEPSYVLRAIGVPDALAMSTLRLCCGRFTTEADVDHAIEHLRDVVGRLR
ncbi:MAG: IscS subfamily cysteine desulfurase [Haliea sp.]|nr:IscS subfamily cysteine desulfurase [Haliea sp.]MDP4789006.1 IscS subfamily cysteine desulfurase [Haliea sp.]MDP4917261.1 IscS subfamily cysteine desulfurase [Haliea sp.]MDP5065559.1 IscS subfamily cysteine desulfurase [Haliea sp.]